MLCYDVDNFIKGCNIYLALKIVRHKPYSNIQFLLVLTHSWKDLLIDFVTNLLISMDWKRDCYDLILVIIDWLIKMVHYKQIKVTIDTPSLIKIIISVIVRYYGLSNSIVTIQRLLFTSKFWLSLCYFLDIKQKLSTVFYLQTDSQTKRQNNMMKAYLRTFVNFKQND